MNWVSGHSYAIAQPVATLGASASNENPPLRIPIENTVSIKKCHENSSLITTLPMLAQELVSVAF